ncbi:protein DSF2 [Rhypophila decipiens]
MSTNRPDFIDLRSKSQASVSRPLRSPRLHVAGEAPPELSPLDAFALQSRLLKKQLEDSAKQGRRMSRLPPLTTDSPLVIQGRSDYFRSMSAESGSEDEHSAHVTGFGVVKTEVDDDLANRPVSMHPRMSGIPAPVVDYTIPLPMRLNRDPQREEPVQEDESESFFGVGARREQSPPPMEDRAGSRTPVVEFLPQQSPAQSFSTTGSPERLQKMDSFETTGLVPPRPIFTQRTSSLMSSPLESTDEGEPSSLGSSFHSLGPRKMSSSSVGVLSPGFPTYQRSPSISSDASGLPRPSFNFSRPLSRVGTPTFDPPARQASSDSHASFLLADDSAHTPVSMHGDGFPVPEGTHADRAAAPSYTYSKYSLPRGKILQRSPDALEEEPQARFSWEGHPVSPPSNVQTYPLVGQPPPSPPTRPSSSAGPRRFDGEPIPRPSLEPSKLSIEVSRAAQEPTPDPSRPSTDGGRPSEDDARGRPSISVSRDAPPSRAAMSTTTSDSASTIKPTRSQHSAVPTMSELSAEEHVSKAVALHEAGSLRESTYHLRHAANQGHPTGMLLYALACRHGWGMKQNQKEGVEWLRKAAESASLEIADEEEHAKEGKPVDVLERKSRKAQFALSIYELGVSHMNGWGIEQDKALALRCFEIAGSWGDADALAEAGFCYAQGVGCKKNLKKSAKFYREAEAKGMSMVGNSWIHKAKYDSDNDKASVKSEKKSKPRKGFFGRKSSA